MKMSSFETFRLFGCAALLLFSSARAFGDHAALNRSELSSEQTEIVELIENGPKTLRQFERRGQFSRRRLHRAQDLSQRADNDTLSFWGALADETYAYPELREVAIAALGQTHSPRALDQLEAFVQDYLHYGQEETPLTLDQSAHLALSAIDAIGLIRDPRSCQILEQVLNRESNAIFLQVSLRAFRAQICPRALRLIMNVYREDALPQIRLAAAEALQNFTATNLDARELLRTRSHSTEMISELRAIAESLAPPCPALLASEPPRVL